MKCSSCGTNYDDKFSFCPYCGTAKSQPPAVRVLVEEPKYEYCQLSSPIVKSGGFFNTYSVRVYEARGTGANASQIYGRSREWASHDGYINSAKQREENNEHRAVLSEFIGELERQGWQEHDSTHQIFRRRIG